MAKSKVVKGYKAFNKDMTCRGMQYAVGGEYQMKEKPVVGKVGYHFCKSIADCYLHYPMSEDTIICKVKALGDVDSDADSKDEKGVIYCTNHILVVSKVKNPRKKSNTSPSSSSGYRNSGICNSGNGNSGNGNSGNGNSGNGNSGHNNSGDGNSGDKNSGTHNSGHNNSGNGNSGNGNSGNGNSGNGNSGYNNSGHKNNGNYNSGHYNSGSFNSGSGNSGNFNSGYYNSGNSNSGSFNSGSHNSGCFCTDRSPKIRLFDKESTWTMEDWSNSRANRIMRGCPCSKAEFVSESSMTVKEMADHPEYETIGGYVKVIEVTDADKQEWWNNLPDADKQEIYSLPNFDKEKFKACTGIEVE